MIRNRRFSLLSVLSFGALLLAGCATVPIAGPAATTGGPQIPTCAECELAVSPNTLTKATGTITMVRPYSAAKVLITPAVAQPEVGYTLSTIPTSGQPFVYDSPNPLGVLPAKPISARLCLYYKTAFSMVCDSVTLQVK